MTSTPCSAKYSGRWPNPSSSIIVRLHRSITCAPARCEVSTRKVKNSLNSGAPPVRSTTAGRCASIHLAILSAVVRPIISVRHGAASTWQCRHAWLHFRPTFTCSVSKAARRNERRFSANLESKRFIGWPHGKLSHKQEHHYAPLRAVLKDLFRPPLPKAAP